MSQKRVCHELTIDHKKEVLDKIQSGKSYRVLAKEYNVAPSTISNIKSKKEDILNMWEQNSGADRHRKLRTTENDEVNSLVFEFFTACRSKNIPVNGPMLQLKARKIADAVGDAEFQASNGWLEKFLKRHNIEFKCISGEGHDVDSSAVQSWKAHLPEICKNFKPEDIYNCDETGVFFKQLPSKTLAAKRESCQGGKNAKDRLTVLLACNMIGEKMKPLVIGKSKCPRAFRNAKIDPAKLPVTWKANQKAWMTGIVFLEWLKSVNNSLRQKNRKILLFLDNATSHQNVELSNVTLVFFPPNMTSALQPLDQGIIQAFKLYYRRALLSKCVYSADNCKTAVDFTSSITALDAVRWIQAAWRDVRQSTIQKCFARSGVRLRDSQEADESDITLNEEDIEMTSMAQLYNAIDNYDWIEKGPLDKFLSFDDALSVHHLQSDDPDLILNDIISAATNFKENEESDSENEGNEDGLMDSASALSIAPIPPAPTFFQALEYSNELVRYAGAHCPSLLPLVFELQSKVEKEHASNRLQLMSQSLITNYFQ